MTAKTKPSETITISINRQKAATTGSGAKEGKPSTYGPCIRQETEEVVKFADVAPAQKFNVRRTEEGGIISISRSYETVLLGLQFFFRPVVEVHKEA